MCSSKLGNKYLTFMLTEVLGTQVLGVIFVMFSIYQ